MLATLGTKIHHVQLNLTTLTALRFITIHPWIVEVRGNQSQVPGQTHARKRPPHRRAVNSSRK